MDSTQALERMPKRFELKRVTENLLNFLVNYF
jgi:hypothetical protein